MQKFEDPRFVGTLDQFKAVALIGELLGIQYGVDCRLLSHAPKADLGQADRSERKGGVPA